MKRDWKAGLSLLTLVMGFCLAGMKAVDQKLKEREQSSWAKN